MMKKQLFCKYVAFYVRYEDGSSYDDHFHTEQPLQDGMEIYHILEERMKVYRQRNHLTEDIINPNVTSIGVVIQDFMDEEVIQLNIFDNSHIKNNKLRKTVYRIKDKYGLKTIKRASELRDEDAVDDVIGFGNIKDVNNGEYG